MCYTQKRVHCKRKDKISLSQWRSTNDWR